MVKMILLKPHEADTIIKYLNLIDQETIDKATEKRPQVHYGIGEMVEAKNSILREVERNKEPTLENNH